MAEYKLIDMKDIDTDLKTLFVLGNGFDLAHGARSSYYDFKSTIGKRNYLRYALETYIDTPDVWGDFENNLALLNTPEITSYLNMDMWLDTFDAYDSESASSTYAAVDMAMRPINEIMTKLPGRLRMWVNTLEVKDGIYPFKGIMKDSKVLCFNYTEFSQKLYGISDSNICYIHGCRKNSKEELILGHIPNEVSREMSTVKPSFISKPKGRYIDSIAREIAFEHINWYDEATSKHCSKIISSHKNFFDALKDINRIVVIGHSLSQVDWDYFKEIISVTSNNDPVWYFSFHCSGDKDKIATFSKEMNINKNKLYLFEA